MVSIRFNKMISVLTIFAIINTLSFHMLTAHSRAAVPIVVTTFIDAVDGNPNDAICESVIPGTDCTLRAAIQTANATPGDDTIILPAGTYTLALAGKGEENAATGDLDILESVSIIGSGGNSEGDPSATVIDAAGVDRGFEINPDPWNKIVNATFKAITIKNGVGAGSSLYEGGGIAFYSNGGSQLSIYNSIISDNTTSGSINDGGGVYINNLDNNPSAQAIIEKSTIVRNKAESANGGGVGVVNANLIIKDSTISNNNAPDSSITYRYGGGVFSKGTSSSVTIERSTLSGNTVYGNGGAIYSVETPITIKDSTVSNNTATSNGGGINWNGSGSLSITNSTIALNNGTNGNGGGLNKPSGTGTVTMLNSIVYGNTAVSGPDISGTISTAEYNLVGNTAGSSGIVSGMSGNKVGVDPKLGPLANNGGPTQTHAIGPDSPALDAGNNAYAAVTDQRGRARVVDAAGESPENMTATVDMGAYERYPTIAAIGNTTIANGVTVDIPITVAGVNTMVSAVSSNSSVIPNDAGHLNMLNPNSSTPTLQVNSVSGGSATITVSVMSDGETAHTSFVVTAAGNPIANDDSYIATEDSALAINAAGGVLANDTDPEFDPVTAVLVSGPTYGTLTLNIDGSFTYTPDANFTGADSFIYKANDGTYDSSPAAVSITVSAVNDGPVAGANTGLTAAEGTAGTISQSMLETTDIDTAPSGLIYTLKTPPTHGSLKKNGADIGLNGTFTQADINTGLIAYQHNGSETSADSFKIDVSDGEFGINGITFAITVTAANDAPVASNDTYSVNEDTLLTVVAASGVLANDTDVESDPLSAVLVSNPTHGTLTLDPNGSFTYAPDANYAGSDSFTYKVNDGTLDSNVATVTVTVNAVDDPPTLSTNVGITIAEGTSGTIGQALLEMTDLDTAPAGLSYKLNIAPTNGMLTDNGTAIRSNEIFTQADIDAGNIAYVHDGSETSTDSFEVIVSDSHTSLPKMTFAITITPVNDAPVAGNDTYSTNKNTPLTVTAARGVLANDRDSESDPLTAAVVASPAHGSLTLNGDGTFTYTPEADYTGNDSFTYKANDGNLDSGTATVTISVVVPAPPTSPVAPALETEKEEISVSVDAGASGDLSAAVAQLNITRETAADGKVKDQVTFTEEIAQQAAKQVQEQGTGLTRILIPDESDIVSELTVNIPKAAHQVLTQAKTDLEIHTESVRIQIPDTSMENFGEDMYFRVVPVKDAQSQTELEEKAKQETVVQKASGGLTVEVLGRPVNIETNVQNLPVTLILPLPQGQLPNDAAERQKLLDNLVVFVQHSDGTRELIKGRVLAYKSDGTLGVEIRVNKFSTFTVVYMEGWTAYASQHAHLSYIKGYADGSFQPERNITRAEFASLLYRIMGLEPSQSVAMPYTDVASDHWAAQSILAISKAGFMSGYSDHTFRPDEPITRAEISVVIAKWKGLKLQSVESESSPVMSDIKGHWAEPYIRALKAQSWISGYPTGDFLPDKEITRAEAVVLLNRVLGRGPLHEAEGIEWQDLTPSHWAYGQILEASTDHMFEASAEGELYKDIKVQ